MTSARKLEANKRNASRSTGPRSPGGKLRSRINARRHGLATPLDQDCETKGKIERLAAVLADGVGSERVERVRQFAEYHFNLARIRAARHEVFEATDFASMTVAEIEIAVRAIEKINRYERRASSKQRRVFREK